MKRLVSQIAGPSVAFGIMVLAYMAEMQGFTLLLFMVPAAIIGGIVGFVVDHLIKGDL